MTGYVLPKVTQLLTKLGRLYGVVDVHAGGATDGHVYACSEYTMLVPASGAFVGQLLPHTLPLTMTRFVAPVPRTAAYICCMPAAWKVVPCHVTVPPFFQTASEMSCGSLYRSNATSGLSLYRAATCCQNVIEFG